MAEAPQRCTLTAVSSITLWARMAVMRGELVILSISAIQADLLLYREGRLKKNSIKSEERAVHAVRSSAIYVNVCNNTRLLSAFPRKSLFSTSVSDSLSFSH